MRNTSSAFKVFLILFFATILLNSSMVCAALIRGSIYDLTLQKESDAIVEINTIPRQLYVSKTGDYAFNVDSGEYTLYARTSTSQANESIIITNDGNYTVDIILEETLTSIPKDLDFDENYINVSTNVPSEDSLVQGRNNMILLITGIILTLLTLVIILYLFVWPNKNIQKKVVAHAAQIVDENLDENEHKLMHILKRDKRVTQKDLRKELPLSEAKISLLVSDLESKGKIRKIKKGRGNILIFVKE